MNQRVVELTDIEEELGEVTNETPEVEVPEKFKGKSTDDIIKAYQNLETEYGRKGNEIGELRRLTDELLGLQLEKKTQETKERVVTSDELFEKPNEVLREVIANDPDIKELKQQIRANSIQQSKKGFEDRHPDWQSVMASSDFQSWIHESSTRTRMLIEADKNYDYETGSELLTLYKQINKVNTEAKEKEVKDKRQQDLKDSKTMSGATGESQPKKVYRRKDLIELRLRNPSKYDAMSDEIMLAYKEGRVK
jgi:hypothetical protein